MPTKAPTKKEVFDDIMYRLSHATPSTIASLSYPKRVSLYNDFKDEINLAEYNKKITKSQYEQLRSRLDILATFIVETAIKKGKYWNY
jgi:hypothetical protein